MPIADSTQLGSGVKITHPDLVNIYGCRIGANTKVGPFVEIQRGAIIGERCKIQSHTFICEGVTIEDEVFVGHGVMFINDLFPRSVDENGQLLGDDDWTLSRTHVAKGASIGSGAVILPFRIGVGSLIGAGAVVTRDVPDYAIVIGNPAHVVGDTRKKPLSQSQS